MRGRTGWTFPEFVKAAAAAPAGGAALPDTFFTVVLASRTSEPEAEAVARSARARGLDTQVVLSNRYSSLTPGYWVVFSGQFPDLRSAEAHLTKAKTSGYADAYTRRFAR